MAREFDTSGSQYLQTTGVTGLPTAFPLTLTAWVRPASNHRGVMIGVADNASSVMWINIRCINVSGGPKASLSIRDSGSTPTNLDGSTGMTIDRWHRVTGVFRGATDREIYLDGVSDGTQTSNRGFPTGLDTITAGQIGDSSPNWYLDGSIADLGIWDVGLSDDEIAGLTYRPARQVRPNRLVCYYPLYGRTLPEPDLSGNGRNLTINTGSIRSDHAPVGTLIKPTATFIFSNPTGGGEPPSTPLAERHFPRGVTRGLNRTTA